MTGNADFPTPPLTMAAFLVLITTYLTKLASAFHGTVEQTAEKNVAKEALLNAMRSLGIYVNTTADGDEVMLAGSGLVFAKTPQPKGPFEIPKEFTVTASREPGRVDIVFGAQPGAAYMVRLSSDPKVDRRLWPTDVDTRRSFSIAGLESNRRYTFIGAYKGASSLLNFSAPVEVVIQ